MINEIQTNYVFKGFGFGVLLPLAKFKTNPRDIKILDIDMEKLKDKVADHLLTYKYAYSGPMLNFIREYMSLSTRELSAILEVAPQTISNWEKDKKKSSVPLDESQRMKLVWKLKLFIFTKKETSFQESLLSSKELSNEYHEEPLVLDDLYKTGA